MTNTKGPSMTRPGPCYCDQPTCSDRICSRLGELRIAHRVITELAAERWQDGITPMSPDIPTMLANIESECEVLVK